MIASNTNESRISIQIVTMGRETVTLELPVGTTVEEAFAQTDIDVQGRDVYCGAVKAEGHFELQDGDILTLVKDKVKAGA